MTVTSPIEGVRQEQRLESKIAKQEEVSFHGVRVCIFDADGTLIDSLEPIGRALNLALGAHRMRPVPSGQLDEFIGPPLRRALGNLLASRGLDQAMTESLLEAFRSAYAELSVQLAMAYPDISEVITSLSKCMRLAVVTSKPTVFARPILDSVGLGPLFEVVEGIDLARAEPKTLTLRRALAHLGIDDPGPDIIIVGDRHYDIEAGRAVGIGTIGVSWGFGSEQELIRAGADSIAHAPRDLLSLLGD